MADLRPQSKLRSQLRVAWTLLIPLLALHVMVASIPHFFGKDVGAGFASVDLSLCVLGSDGSADLLVGGDSRAKQQVDPLLLEAETGLRAINVAEAITFGGDLPTLANALRKYPKALAKEPLLVVSVSVTGFNDLALNDLPAASVLNWMPRDHLRVATHRPAEYLDYVSNWYAPFLKRHILHKMRGTGFVCGEGLHLPPAVLAARGFRPHADAVTPDPDRKPPAREDFLLDGGRYRAFSKSLAWLAGSQVRGILLYQAPMAPAWKDDPAHALDVEMEHRFADLVAAEAAKYPKVKFVDFVRGAPEDLSDAHFADNYHLNAEGTPLFTRRLAALLRDAGWIAPQKSP